MRNKLSIVFMACSIPFLLASRCKDTVSYDPATQSDASPATVNLLVKSPGWPDAEVGQRAVPPAPGRLAFGLLGGTTRRDFSVLATAKDPESGIQQIQLKLTRTVCFRTADGSIAQAPFATVVRKEATYMQNSAPVQASLGDSGVIDPNDLTPSNFLIFTNAQGNRAIGIGVVLVWSMEAKNFAGGSTSYSEVIYVTAGDTSCSP